MKLNKNDFIKKIIKNFPSSFKDISSEEVYEKYDIAIENNIDYDKLYELFLKDWKFKSAPTPAYFQQFFSQCRNPLKLINMPSERRAALVKVANWLNSQAYIDCLYKGKKAPFEIRELYRKYKFSETELDQVRVSGEIGEE